MKHFAFVWCLLFAFIEFLLMLCYYNAPLWMSLINISFGILFIGLAIWVLTWEGLNEHKRD